MKNKVKYCDNGFIQVRKINHINELKDHFDKSVFQCEVDKYLPMKIRPPSNRSNSQLMQVMTEGTHVVRLE